VGLNLALENGGQRDKKERGRVCVSWWEQGSQKKRCETRPLRLVILGSPGEKRFMYSWDWKKKKLLAHKENKGGGKSHVKTKRKRTRVWFSHKIYIKTSHVGKVSSHQPKLVVIQSQNHEWGQRGVKEGKEGSSKEKARKGWVWGGNKRKTTLKKRGLLS